MTSHCNFLAKGDGTRIPNCNGRKADVSELSPCAMEEAGVVQLFKGSWFSRIDGRSAGGRISQAINRISPM